MYEMHLHETNWTMSVYPPHRSSLEGQTAFGRPYGLILESGRGIVVCRHFAFEALCKPLSRYLVTDIRSIRPRFHQGLTFGGFSCQRALDRQQISSYSYFTTSSGSSRQSKNNTTPNTKTSGQPHSALVDFQQRCFLNTVPIDRNTHKLRSTTTVFENI
jgi:hypothetical protein